MGVLAEVMAIKDREDASKVALANLPNTLIQGYVNGLGIQEKKAQIADLQAQAQARKGAANLDTLMKASTLKRNAYEMKDQSMLDMANAMQGSVIGTHTDYRQALDPAVAAAMPPMVGPSAVTSPGSLINDVVGDQNKKEISDITQVVPDSIIKASGELDQWGQPTQKALMSKKMADTMIANSAEKVKPATDAERTANMFTERAIKADQLIQQLDPYVSEQGFDKWLQNKAPNFAKNVNQQKYEQAQRDFVNAVLRPESGAVISPAEFDNARLQYFPQPGDSKEVIAQKAQNRLTEIEGLKGKAGKAFTGDKTSPIAKVETKKSSSSPVVGRVYRDASGNTAIYQGGDPTDPKSWK